MSKRLSVRLGGLCIEADLSNASMILREPIGQQANPNSVNISVAEGTKQYDVMGYTTDITTMRLIFQNKTLRSSSLSNVNLNDIVEMNIVLRNTSQKTRMLFKNTIRCRKRSLQLYMNIAG